MSSFSEAIANVNYPDAITTAQLAASINDYAVQGNEPLRVLRDLLRAGKMRRATRGLFLTSGYARIDNPDAKTRLWYIDAKLTAAYARTDLSSEQQLVAVRGLLASNTLPVVVAPPPMLPRFELRVDWHAEEAVADALAALVLDLNGRYGEDSVILKKL